MRNTKQSIGKNTKRKTIRKVVDNQFDRLSKRYGETPSHDDPKLKITPMYLEPVEFCIDLFRQGKHMSDAVYITRLYFTHPDTPGYIPIERWDEYKFRSMLIRWIKRD